MSYDSKMLSNLSVGMPIDLLCYTRDSLQVTMKRRFDLSPLEWYPDDPTAWTG